ncbi:MAG TPA: glycerol-3-phosphate 1-O-acyltransferase PlsY [Acidobacteriaceae bacterium]|jgi:glycerol-3-phosphate acyltransferase PlsY
MLLSIIGVIAYLLGSIPFGLILVRIFRKQDIREQGSGNIGATNVIRSGGKGLGAVTFLLDAAKGFVAVLLAWQIALHAHQTQLQAQNLAATAAICAILGHIYTVWLGFKGGKGVATGFGVFLGIAPLSALVALLAFILVFALSRYVSLASIVAALVFPLAALLRHHEPLTPFMIAAVVLLPLIVIAKHHANIRRLLAGTEYRFGRSKAAAA